MGTTTAERTYTIGQVSGLLGISTHTLRFYDREGLFLGPVQRDTVNRRLFCEQEVAWLRVGLRLRSAGMPLPDVRRFADLVRAGAGAVEERFALLREHVARVRAQLTDLQDVLATVEPKVAAYADHLDQGTADRIWLDGRTCPDAAVPPRA